MQQLPIIAIDDDPIHLTLTQRLMVRLHKLNIETIQDSTHGFERMKALIANGEAAIILLDLKMPQLDGYRILRRIKDEEQDHHLYIVVLSNSDNPRDVQFAHDCGVAGYLVKPTNHKLLRLKIDEITKQHQSNIQRS